MKNLNTQIQTTPSSGAWTKSERKLKQLFTKLTGYDYMREESRADLHIPHAANPAAEPVIGGNAYTSNLRAQYLYLFNRE